MNARHSSFAELPKRSGKLSPSVSHTHMTDPLIRSPPSNEATASAIMLPLHGTHTSCTLTLTRTHAHAPALAFSWRVRWHTDGQADIH